MSLYGTLVEDIQKLFDSDDVKRDNVVNKLYYKVTALTLAGAALVLSLHQVCIFVPLYSNHSFQCSILRHKISTFSIHLCIMLHHQFSNPTSIVSLRTTDIYSFHISFFMSATQETWTLYHSTESLTK